MIRFFYSLLVYFLLPFTCLKLIYRGFKQPDYLKHWGERYGFYSASTRKTWGKRKTLWIHAVSVGETKAAIPFIQLFLKIFFLFKNINRDKFFVNKKIHPKVDFLNINFDQLFDFLKFYTLEILICYLIITR